MLDLAKLVRWSEARRKDKPGLKLPVLEHLRNPRYQGEVDKVMKAAAEAIAKTKLLFRWRRSSGLLTLAQWEPVSKVFTLMDDFVFRQFLGTHFDLQDTAGVGFGLPAKATAARLFDELLKDTIGLEFATWALVDRWRQAGK